MTQIPIIDLATSGVAIFLVALACKLVSDGLDVAGYSANQGVLRVVAAVGVMSIAIPILFFNARGWL